MFDTTEIRRTAQNILDGMSFNREKLVRTILEMCSQIEAHARVLQAERDKNKALTAENEALKAKLAQAQSAGSSGMPGGAFGEAFGDIFGDLFKPTGQSKPGSSKP
jgi:hypothetical protein